jgi:hypothetical protein
MIGHHDKKAREFKPRCNGGGSKPGKPQGRWPRLFTVCADAILLSVKGTRDMWSVDRRMFIKVLEVRMDTLFPGWQEHVQETMPRRKTKPTRLLSNRVYKMYYNGTSARGRKHDPTTRATQSKEHWTNYVAGDSPLRPLHDKVQRTIVNVVPNWKEDWKAYL